MGVRRCSKPGQSTLRIALLTPDESDVHAGPGTGLAADWQRLETAEKCYRRSPALLRGRGPDRSAGSAPPAGVALRLPQSTEPLRLRF